jgi:hypothetical protein
MKKTGVEICSSQHLAGIIGTILYLRDGAEPMDDHSGCSRYNHTFESFSENECYTYFRFKKTDLPRLLVALKIPKVVIAETSKFSCEEVLLSSLYRLNNKTLCDVANMFGREYSQWGKSWRWFICHIWDTFKDHMTDNLHYWQPIFPM